MEKIEYKLIATTVGLNKLNNAALLEKPIKIAKWVVGDGGGEPYQVDASQTQLKNKVDEGRINSVTPNTETTSSVEFVIDHSRGPYFVREAGFLDSEGDLIYIASVPTQEKVNSDSSVTDMTFEFMINFFNSDAITFTVDPNKAIASHTHVSNEIKRATGYCGTWQESPHLKNEGDFVYCVNSEKRFRPIEYPYKVDSSLHPDPNELVGSELVDVSKLVSSKEIKKPYSSLEEMKADTSLEDGDFARVIGGGFFSDYVITKESTNVPLNNGLFAELQFDHAALDSAEEFTVGLADRNPDYLSINDAFCELSRKKVSYTDPSTYNLNDIPIRVVKILKGFKIKEQLLVQSLDLSHFVIVSEDDVEVEICREFLTIEMSGRFPAFGARNSASLPTIGAKFVMDESGEATNRDAVFVTGDSSVHVLPGCGVRNAGARGLHVSNGSRCNARSSSFPQAKEAALRVANGSHAAVRDSNFSDAGTNAMQISSGSFVDANSVNCSGAQYCGLFSQASFVNAQDSNFDNCQKSKVGHGYDGAVHVIQGSNVFAAGSTANNSGRTAFECHDAALYLYDDVPQRTVEGKNAGISGIVNVAGTVIATRADLSGSASWGIDTVNASTLDAESAILTGCGDVNTGPIRHRNGQGNYRAVQGDGTAKYGCLSDRGASISLEGASLKGHEQGLSAQGGSQVNAIGLDCSNCTTVGISANNGSNVNFRSGIATRAGTPGGFDISIANGSTVVANGSLGTLSQEENKNTSEGIIYR